MITLACASTPGPTTTAGVAPTTSSIPLASRDVSLEAAGLTVHGTLTLPAGEGPFPAVLFIAGSGPTDRDWNNPLLPGANGSGAQLAQALADAGIATFRYDKRASGKTAVPDSIRWEDYLAEQQAALALLRGTQRVNPEALYVAGHSEGGAHGLKLAQAEGEDLAGLILLATAGRPLKTLVVEQVAAQLRAALPAEEAATETLRLETALTRIGEGRTVDPAEAVIPPLRPLLSAFQAPISREFSRKLLVFDPVETLAALPHRVLVLNGRKDVQVSAERDAARLASARDHGITLALIDDADHVLKHEPRPSSELDASAGLAYSANGRELSDAAVKAIVDFIRAPR